MSRGKKQLKRILALGVTDPLSLRQQKMAVKVFLTKNVRVQLSPLLGFSPPLTGLVKSGNALL